MWGHRQEELEVQGGWGEGRREGGSRGGPAVSGWGCIVGRKVLMAVDRGGGVCPLPCITHLGEPTLGLSG